MKTFLAATLSFPLFYSTALAEENRQTLLKDALHTYYERKESVSQIMTIAELYQQFNTLDLYTHVFPLQKDYLYSYRSTWGGKRGWGGRRMHEGTDLFAGYGTPVLATTYGKIEALGWNDYGGWRVGLRDIHNVYHYYAHLSSFKEGLKQGDIVKAGDLIGYVGSSGYSKRTKRSRRKRGKKTV